MTRCTIRRPEPKNAFQRLIDAVVANDEKRIEDEATRIARIAIATKRKAKPCRAAR
jgi:hypothetical protein